MKVDGFDWDPGNRKKGQRHGIPIEAIEEFLRNPIWVAPDPKHSQTEERFLAVGKSRTGRPMIVVFTFREASGLTLIRPITARYMHQKEAEKYEQAFTKVEK